MASDLLSGHDELRCHWSIFLIVGVLLVVLGMLALCLQPIAGFFLTILWGSILLICAGVHTVGLFYSRRWQGFFLHMLSAVLAFIVGLFLLQRPVEAMVEITLLIAILLFVGGLFRAVTSLFLQFPNWLWSFLSGMIALLLGAAVWLQWPSSGLWFFGMCVGIDLLFQGWSWVMFGLALRSRPA